jgi:hypothetical protein
MKFEGTAGAGFAALQDGLGARDELVHLAEPRPDCRKLDSFFDAAEYLKLAFPAAHNSPVWRQAVVGPQLHGFIGDFFSGWKMLKPRGRNLVTLEPAVRTDMRTSRKIPRRYSSIGGPDDSVARLDGTDSLFDEILFGTVTAHPHVAFARGTVASRPEGKFREAPGAAVLITLRRLSVEL